jgi:hypothetical protein
MDEIQKEYDLKPLYDLKDLLVKGSDAEILSFIRENLAPNIDSYINLSHKIQEIESEYLKMRIKSTEKQIELQKLINRMNESLQKDLEKLKNS